MLARPTVHRAPPLDNDREGENIGFEVLEHKSPSAAMHRFELAIGLMAL
jgi:hypothetical protein